MQTSFATELIPDLPQTFKIESLTPKNSPVGMNLSPGAASRTLLVYEISSLTIP